MPRSHAEDLSEPLHLLAQARAIFTQRDLAAKLKVTPRTISRWEKRETPCPPLAEAALRDVIRSTVRPTTGAGAGAFTFIDLFAGIGGICTAFEQAGGRCVFTSELDDWAKKTYLANHEIAGSKFVGDIRNVRAEDIPDHDVLLAGFPCQPFSIAGVSKNNSLGRPHGFENLTQGTLFFDAARIIAAKRPCAFLLENVKNLLNHDKGRTFRVILDTLQTELGYTVDFKVVDGADFVPQHRERLLVAGFRRDIGFSFDKLIVPSPRPALGTILHPENGSEKPEAPYTEGPRAVVNSKYILSDKLWAYLQAYADKHRKAGHGFGFGLVDSNSTTRTLSARYYKDGSEILLSRGKGLNPRRLTPRECARLMGFPDTFQIPVSDMQAYKQFGNCVVVPAIRAAAEAMAPYILALKTKAIEGLDDPPEPTGN
jgi:DNA (cytosine-5)-methyltransferase 1